MDWLTDYQKPMSFLTYLYEIPNIFIITYVLRNAKED